MYGRTVSLKGKQISYMNCHSASIMVYSGQGRTSRELSFQVTAGKVHILIDAVITGTVGRGVPTAKR